MMTAETTVPGIKVVPKRDPIQTDRVQLMMTCLCDAFFDDAARASVECLEKAGCRVVCPPEQTCCGQAAYTSGDWETFRHVVRHVTAVFADPAPIVVPSGSCAAAMFHEAPIAFEGDPDLPRVQRLANRTWELADFLVNGLGIRSWPGRLDARIAVHDACHTRGTPTGPAMRTLLDGIDGLERVEFPDEDVCCGFGGVFSVSHPHISSRMGRRKVANVLSATPDLVVSADMSCLMHQRGIAEREGCAYPVRHLSQVLRDSMVTGS
jgi:L-lactate dehydrogenase complex protein LldE